MGYFSLFILLTISVLAGCNLQKLDNQDEVSSKQPLQKKIIEPVKRQILTGKINYSQEDTQEAIDVVNQLLK